MGQVHLRGRQRSARKAGAFSVLVLPKPDAWPAVGLNEVDRPNRQVRQKPYRLTANPRLRQSFRTRGDGETRCKAMPPFDRVEDVGVPRFTAFDPRAGEFFCLARRPKFAEMRTGLSYLMSIEDEFDRTAPYPTYAEGLVFALFPQHQARCARIHSPGIGCSRRVGFIGTSPMRPT